MAKAKAKAKSIGAAVREVCLWLPEAEEFVSHGSPNFRPRGGKVYAIYVVNHHGDGRVALWLAAPPGAQEQHVRNTPKHFFVPPYVGPSGWLGVQLDQGLSWKRIAALVREAYEHVAPAKLRARIGSTPAIDPPTAELTAEQRDPMLGARPQAVLKAVRALVGDWPEVGEDHQFGFPVWRAGKRTFVQAYHLDGRLMLGFRVGIERQGLLTTDPRYRIPPYMGHNGWIALDVTRNLDRAEVRALALDSYRHFALKRMLAALPVA